ncbi:phosphoethanolamine transferase [Zooshikella harenae]|uniref:Phosphoethanolamine--lipid A transferase n=1 Tax=Zooshikella harenae TaxID=2827238 RepID=A0ABS5ZE20_9GAMM|nr:phosphoethanolamine--lipid A transferase [Zooshikella harenae]MBU2712316.1 phosphoethanolamine--lipid A transferase [Zooshikella harenae]
MHHYKLTARWIIFFTTIFILTSGNIAFFKQVLAVYPWSDNAAFILSLSIMLGGVIMLLLSLFSIVIPIRVVASIFLLFTASISYFSDQFGSIIDVSMIQNMVETNTQEAMDLVSTELVFRIVLLGILPATLLWWLPVKKAGWGRELGFTMLTGCAALAIIILTMLPFSDYYASFFRQHKPLRYYTSPIYPLYSATKYIVSTVNASETSTTYTRVVHTVEKVKNNSQPKLFIMIVGETARADHFSLNGYSRNTNPGLSKEKRIISYQQIHSCGTSTAVSVPCMFSFSNQADFNLSAANYTENVLDVLVRAGVNVLWRDNNSNSKGVALRVPYQDFRNKKLNPQCDEIECHDTGMLAGLQQYINQQQGDIFIVLHQMGSHGPAYFKRYPISFEKFKPACHSIELSTCTQEEIINAFDNSILYTDYFLSKVISLLKANAQYETAMFYVSDHGESLGEHNVYLHGLPYWFAPDTQKHVPLIAWIGPTSNIDYPRSLTLKETPNTHDAIAKTLLDIFELKTDIYPYFNQIKPLFYLRAVNVVQ